MRVELNRMSMAVQEFETYDRLTVAQIDEIEHVILSLCETPSFEKVVESLRRQSERLANQRKMLHQIKRVLQNIINRYQGAEKLIVDIAEVPLTRRNGLYNWMDINPPDNMDLLKQTISIM